ncbi:MAG: bacterioferritin [Bdellovibrionaceae bacterium]|nr:bacterioferritin [Pseudobdellovibrionaceae bacterium]MBX3033464.1 bacterioferritin [Pseudobdellovibrionaceae bacterium]
MKNDQAVEILNKILEHELAGVVRYTHYALMVFGHNRIPICSWLRDQAKESLTHADEVGELITSFGGHPSLKIGKLLETDKHKINDILKESLAHEEASVLLYRQLFELSEHKSILLEEFARKMIYAEELHITEVIKMMREPGALAGAKEPASV